MKTSKLTYHLTHLFPKRIGWKNDYLGLMTGKLKENTNRILLCLDFDEIVYDYVSSLTDKVDLIITHHPFIYGTKKKVFETNPQKRKLCKAIDKLKLPVYSMHTNFDAGEKGMNVALANALKLNNIHLLENSIMARGGYLKEPMEIHDFAKYVNKCLNVEYSHLINGGKSMIQKVAILGGGGSFDWWWAKENYDIYISGDTPHHIRRDVLSYKFNYLDVPHEVEKIFIPQMKKILLELDPSLEIIEFDHEKLPELIIK